MKPKHMMIWCACCSAIMLLWALLDFYIGQTKAAHWMLLMGWANVFLFFINRQNAKS